jgi:hypothetical protein
LVPPFCFHGCCFLANVATVSYSLILHPHFSGGTYFFRKLAAKQPGAVHYASIQTYICVPAGDLDKPAEELGKAVASLRLAAEAVRLKCLWLHSMLPERDSICLLEIINRNLEGATNSQRQARRPLGADAADLPDSDQF